MLNKTSAVILPETLQLLEILQSDRVFDSFYLVGGTALALHIGHRLSVDLDLFTTTDFDTVSIEQHLTANYLFASDYVAKNTLKGFVNHVKVDFIAHPFALVQPILRVENLRLASLEDIAAMKLNAIAHNGTRQKDFYDLYFLLEIEPLSIWLNAYETKYPKSNPLTSLKSLTYFNDVNLAFDKPMLNRKVTFKAVQQRLTKAVQHPNLRFS